MEIKLRKLKVGPIWFDSENSSGIILLSDINDFKIIPLVADLWESLNILYELSRYVTPTPTVFKMIENILDTFNYSLEEIIIDEYKNGTYHSIIILNSDEGKKIIDCKPTNAIALAIRLNAPIWINEKIYQENSIFLEDLYPEIENLNQLNDDLEINEWLENIKPDDFSD